jgi:hypothetical protein
VAQNNGTETAIPSGMTLKDFSAESLIRTYRNLDFFLTCPTSYCTVTVQ